MPRKERETRLLRLTESVIRARYPDHLDWLNWTIEEEYIDGSWEPRINTRTGLPRVANCIVQCVGLANIIEKGGAGQRCGELVKVIFGYDQLDENKLHVAMVHWRDEKVRKTNSEICYLCKNKGC